MNALLKDDVSRRNENISIIVNMAGVHSTVNNTQGGTSITLNLRGSSLSESKLQQLVEEEVKKRIETYLTHQSAPVDGARHDGNVVSICCVSIFNDFFVGMSI